MYLGKRCEKMWEKQPCRHQRSRRAGGAAGTHSGAEIPLQTMVRQDLLLQPTEAHSAGVIHMQPTAEQQMCPAGDCDPVESPHWSFPGSICGPVEVSPHWNRFVTGLCDPMGDPRQSSLILKGFTLWEVFLLEQFMKDCFPWEGHYTGVGSLRRKVWQFVMNWLQTPFPVHLHCLGGGGGGIQSEVESGKKGRREEGVFQIGFYYPIL